MPNDNAAGSQPGPLPLIKRLQPVNPPGHRRFLEWRWEHWDETNPGERKQWLLPDGSPHPPDGAIYHSTVRPNLWGSSAPWLATDPASEVSINTLANPDGSLTEIVPPMWQAYHAGCSLLGWENYRVLGLEFENASGNPRGDKETYPDVQINAGAYRMATWAFSFGFDMGRIRPHRLAAVYCKDSPKAGQLGRKSDPVGDFPDAKFRAQVEAWLTFFYFVPVSERAYYIEGRVLDTTASEYGFVGPTTISATVAERVLRERKSPILSERSVQEYMDLCKREGINFAVALAFTVHENGAGTLGPTAVLCNWGAVRTPEDPSLALPQLAKTELGNFAVYESWYNALADWLKRIKGPKYLGSNPKWGMLDVLRKYAPKTDALGKNNPEAYYQEVQALCRTWENQSQL